MHPRGGCRPRFIGSFKKRAQNAVIAKTDLESKRREIVRIMVGEWV
jgi:hypothetical protein